MSPDEALRRIEERHPIMLDGCRKFCGKCRISGLLNIHYELIRHPCPTVKLARALADAATEFSRIRLAFGKDDSRYERCKYEAEKAERVLAEVAGE